MFVAVCCDRGAPGATTTALALATAISEYTVVVEADPYGGDLALRCRAGGRDVLPETPTVLTVSTAARTSHAPDLVSVYAHRFTDGVGVIPGHMSAEQAAGMSDWSPLAAALHASSTHVVADLGRIHMSSPSLSVAAAADVLVVVGRADVGAVVHLRERLARLVPAVAAVRGRPPVVVPVVLTLRRAGGRHAADVRRLLADSPAGPLVGSVGWVAWDPRGVARLERGEEGRGLTRTPLLRSAATVVDAIVTAAAGQAALPPSGTQPSHSVGAS
ncbi:hypothetical protein ASG88_00140 [Nocardioides sp. Soil777]|uniref:hypothetical protein n=1 Tax=Nocardioides sp. Soil777 TaxID=1736409 RepID=UPI000702BC36|nr:hypothetical protein [Nocardioides sp. Soil777]KRF07312.1 hypothetical protein ASG88_00140 [Nocardioides sp. Soil777]